MKKVSTNRSVTPTFYIKMLIFNIKGRFPEFRMYPNFANLFSKFLGSTVYKEISKLQLKVQIKSLRLAVL